MWGLTEIVFNITTERSDADSTVLEYDSSFFI